MVNHETIAITPAGEFLRRAHAALPARSTSIGGSREPTRRRLLTSTTPVPGESLRGLVARACAANYLPNSWGILKHLGLNHRNRVLVSEEPNLVPADLAYAISTTEAEISQRRYDPLGPGHISFFGLDVHRGLIETRVRRFSPTSLSTHPVHRAIWELRDLPFCPFGWDILQDRCHCEGENGIIQGWTRTLAPVDCCDQCGEPLADLAPVVVPEHLRDGLSLLLTIVGTSEEERAAGRSLPQALVAADRSRLFEVVRRLAAAMSEEADYDLQDSISAVERCGALETACQALLEWPHGMDRLQPAAHVGPWTWGRLASAYIALGTAQDLALSSHGNARLRRTRSSNAGPGNFDLLGIRPASEISGIRDETLASLWENGTFTQHKRVHGDRLLPAIERDELRAYAARWHDRIDIDTFGYRNGISAHGIEQLIALGRLPAMAPTAPGAPPSITTADANEFVRQVQAGAHGSFVEGIPLRDAAYAIGGRLKPWGPIFAAMMDGEIGYKFEPEGPSLLERVLIDPNHVERLRACIFDRGAFPEYKFSKRIVQREALETLNIRAGGERVLKGLKAQGVNPRTLAVVDVEERAREIMTLPEIAFAMGLDYSSAHHRLRRAGWPKVMPGAWARSMTEPHIDLIADWGRPGRKSPIGSRLFEQLFMKEAVE